MDYIREVTGLSLAQLSLWGFRHNDLVNIDKSDAENGKNGIFGGLRGTQAKR